MRDYKEEALPARQEDIHYMEELRQVSPEKLAVMNRRERRGWDRGRHVKHTGRAGGKTGQPNWFKDMKWEGKRKALLRKLPVTTLVTHGICTEDQAKALQESALKTIWDVVDAGYQRMLDVRGFGPKTLAKFRQDAKIKGQLDMNWKVPA